MTCPVSKKTQILVLLSSSFKVRCLYSFFVIPTSRGTGASTMSISGWGNIGTNAKHHLKGLRSELKPRMAEEIMLAFPTKITDFSSITADKSYRKVEMWKVEKSWGQNHLQSTNLLSEASLSCLRTPTLLPKSSTCTLDRSWPEYVRSTFSI